MIATTTISSTRENPFRPGMQYLDVMMALNHGDISAAGAGAREVYLIEEPMSAAIGADILGESG